jgi:hypothetical protein
MRRMPTINSAMLIFFDTEVHCLVAASIKGDERGGGESSVERKYGKMRRLALIETCLFYPPSLETLLHQRSFWLVNHRRFLGLVEMPLSEQTQSLQWVLRSDS